MQAQTGSTSGLFVCSAKRGSHVRLKQISIRAGSGQEMKSTEVGFEGGSIEKPEEREETDVFQAWGVWQ